MDSKVIECPKCGTSLSYEDEHIGQVLSCPSCGVEFELVLPDDEEGEGAPPPAAAEETPKLPESMKANRLVDGRTCPRCGQGIFFGQDVHNCQTCGQTVHDACWEDGGCPTCSRPVHSDPDGPPIGLRDEPLSLKKRPSLPPPVPPVGGGGSQEGMKECRFCGEQIQAKAKKCRHCGEYQEDKDRKPARNIVSQSGDEDDKLTVGEWLFGILCGLIACIVGIVWLVQGKKKGWKLILVAILSQIILRAILAAVMAAQ